MNQSVDEDVLEVSAHTPVFGTDRRKRFCTPFTVTWAEVGILREEST